MLLLGLLVVASPLIAEETDTGVIRLEAAAPSPEIVEDRPSGAAAPPVRQGFDLDAFESRLESLWFQRKAFLADGRDAAAARQVEMIREYCSEERVHRVEAMAGALLAEARRYISEGSYDEAFEALDFATVLDPGRPQIYRARAQLFWSSGRGYLAAGGQMLAAYRAAITAAVRELTLVNRLPLILVVALAASVFVFSLLMLLKYQIPLRHEIEEWLARRFDGPWLKPAAWAVIFLPLMVWFAAGWVAFYWILAVFRFMAARERLAAVVLLFACALSVPGFRVAVAVYGMTTDPLARTTLGAVDSEYDPDRIVKLRRLVDAYPDNATYRFLLAGVYKQGNYFEDAYVEYKRALDIDPYLHQALINVGNIFLQSGQAGEAVPQYAKALEIKRDSVLAYFNMHLAQSEVFRFKEAEQSLIAARSLDSRRVTELLAASGGIGNRAPALDATLDMTSIWETALGGGNDRQSLRTANLEGEGTALSRLLSPVSIVALLTLVACGFVLFVGGSGTARRCIRCGCAFCRLCKTSLEGKEYCIQCLHLYVLGGGLAPKAKNQKLYEVERYERRSRFRRKLASLVLPGSAQLLRGRAGWGVALLLLWFAGVVAWRPDVLGPWETLIGLDLRLDLLGPSPVPAVYGVDVFGTLALASLLAIWLSANLWLWRRQSSER